MFFLDDDLELGTRVSDCIFLENNIYNVCGNVLLWHKNTEWWEQ